MSEGALTLQLLFMTTLVVLPLIPAVVLFKVLPSTGEVSGPWKSLNVKFSGPFAAYLMLFGCLLHIRPTEFDYYKMWHVDGVIAFDQSPDDEKANAHDVKVRLIPPDPVVHGNGSGGAFRFDIVVPRKNGRSTFPSLLLEHPNFEARSFSLALDRSGDGSEVDIRHDESENEILVRNLTLTSKRPAKPYGGANAQLAEHRRGGGQ